MTTAEFETIFADYDGKDIPDKINKWGYSMITIAGSSIELNTNFLYRPIYAKDQTGKVITDDEDKPIVLAKFGTQGHVLHCVSYENGILHFVPADDTYTERWFIDQYIPISAIARVFMFANKKSQYRIDYENKVKQEREESGFSSRPHKPFRKDFGANAVAAERSYPTPNKMSYPEGE